MRDKMSRSDCTSRSVSSTPEKRQRQDARPSAPTGADRLKKTDPPMDVHTYMSAQLAKLENELRDGPALEKRSANDDSDNSSDSATSTGSSESQAPCEAADAMEHYVDDFDYGSLML